MPALVGVDRIDFVEPVGQIRRLAHVVDGLANRPIRRHGDEFGLHAPAGGILGIKQPALDRDTLGRRQLFQDFHLVGFVEVFEQFDRVVGLELANALRDRLGFELFEDFLADGVVDLVQRREVEIGAGQFHQADAVIGLERSDQVTEIGFMQLGNDLAQELRIIGLDAARDLFDEFGPDFAFLVAHRQAFEDGAFSRRGNVRLFDHDALAV